MEAQEVTTIICRQCHAELDVASAVCTHCGAATGEVEFDRVATARSPATSDEKLLDRPWFLIVLILHVGILGIPAYWATKYSVPTRVGIIIASILYTAFAVAVIVWSLKQIFSLF